MRASRGTGGILPPENILRYKLYVPIRCHFLHFEIIVNGNTAPKKVKNWENIKRKREVSGQNGRVGIYDNLLFFPLEY